MRLRLIAASALLAVLAAPRAWAKATFTIEVSDDPGVGFNDTTPATPVGGNTGTTVGEQRLKAFQAAADAWGRILESSVPIVVEASFGPLDCSSGVAVMGQAAPYSISNRSDLPTTGNFPLALANKILDKDLAPNSPDITAQFNSSMVSCVGIDWYYGLDGNAGTKQANLLTTVIHELGHGLGFTDGVDANTGAFSSARPTVFSTQMLDEKTGKHFSDMTNAERKAALFDVRQLVWDGKRTDAVAARFLAKGAPSLQISPSPASFVGAIGEANFGPFLADLPSITAEVVAGSMSSDCKSVSGSFSGKAALVTAPTNCASVNAANLVQKAGGLALLFFYGQTGCPPPIALEFRTSDVARFNITIPTLAVTLDDAGSINNTSGATATLSADKNQLVGANVAGHALLFATNPLESGSTGAHWDPLVRPNLTMEPVEPVNPVMYLDMERAVLWDIGWTGSCGNGSIDSGEACDDGEANSDYFPDACRLDCTRPKCGDGVVDSGEECDPGGNGKLANPNCDASCHLMSGGTGGAGGAGGTGGNGASSGMGGAGGKSAATGTGGTSGSSGAGGKSAATGTGGSNGSGGAGGKSAATGTGGTSGSSGATGMGGTGASGGTTGMGGSGGTAAGSSGGTTVSVGSGGGASSGGGSTGGGASSGGGSDGGGAGGTGQGSKGSGCSCRTGHRDLDAGASMIVVGFALVLSFYARIRSTRATRRRRAAPTLKGE
jgi:hypothetical protein